MTLPRFEGGETEGGTTMRRGVPAKRIGGRLVTTVFDLALAQYGVGREGLPGEWPSGYDDALEPLHARLAGGDHRRRRRALRCGSPASSPTTPSAPRAAR